MIEILNIEPANYSPEARQILATIGHVVELQGSRRALLAQIPRYDALITRLSHTIDREVLDRAERLKVVVSPTTGLDHIDLGHAAAKGIEVLSLRSETAFLKTIASTAEHTWGLLLALVRHTPDAFRSVQKGQWNRDQFRGNELRDKRLGIVGLGRIGSMVARYGRAFRMKVAGFDPYLKHWPSGIERKRTLTSLLAESDILTLHVPLNAETLGLIGTRELRRLPKGAVVINTSRGAVIDERALLTSLANGDLQGAAVDVISEERATKLRRNRLVMHARRNSNLIITPHIGGATVEAMAKTEIHMAKRLRAAFARRSRTGN